jgi:hypothetical protein
VSDKKYIVREPYQTRQGGWICPVFEADDLIYETYQQTKQWAFQAAVMWLHDLTDGKLVRVDGTTPEAPLEAPKELPPEAPPESPTT